MFSTELLFITITLIILCVIAMKLKTPKVIIPLGIIYLVVLLYELLINLDGEITENKKLVSTDKQSQPVQVLDERNPLFLKDKIIQKDKIATNNTNVEGKPEKSKPKTQQIKKIEEKISNPTKIVNSEPEKELNNNLKNFNNVLTLKEIKICKNIKNRKPIGTNVVFPSTVDSLYCFTTIKNIGRKAEVKHIWFYENQMMTQIRYNVKNSNTYRSWTKKTISTYQIGNWRVEVQDKNGTIIGSKRFEIKKSS